MITCVIFLWKFSVVLSCLDLKQKEVAGVKDAILLAATSAFCIYPYLFISSVTNSTRTKAREMGGTEQDSH